jgi:putative tricarboxylic transport membrane protein
MAPAAPGGWNTTAREIQTALQSGVVDQGVEVFSVEGLGRHDWPCSIRKSQRGRPVHVDGVGIVMIGVIATNQASVALDEIGPIARLTAEFEIIVVPKDSQCQSLADLIADFQANPDGVS